MERYLFTIEIAVKGMMFEAQVISPDAYQATGDAINALQKAATDNGSTLSWAEIHAIKTVRGSKVVAPLGDMVVTLG